MLAAMWERGGGVVGGGGGREGEGIKAALRSSLRVMVRRATGL